MMSRTDSRLRSGLDALLSGPRPLSYSDDTQMMIAVAESLVRTGGVSGSDILSALAENYDPARGYGHGMKRALEAFQRGNRRPGFSTWGEGSKGNGGAVRVVPVAVDTIVGAVRHHRLVTETSLDVKLVAIAALLEASADQSAAVAALGNGVLADEAVPLALFCFLRWAPDYWAATRARLDVAELAQELGPLTVPPTAEQQRTPS